jgi:hypothetical protein
MAAAAAYLIGISGKKRTGKFMRKADKGYVTTRGKKLCQTRKKRSRLKPRPYIHSQ